MIQSSSSPWASEEHKKKTALIGYTGFVGSNLLRQADFTNLYNKSNIYDSLEKSYELVVSAAPGAEKWKANLEPEKDLNQIDDLINSIANINTEYFIHISTIDVYREVGNVNEDTPIELDGLHPYGKNRYYLEEFVRDNFKNHLIIRLPALFGPGLKKNFIFDLIHSNCLNWTHKDSEFQFYGLSHLWNDITIARENNIKTINLTSEPISAHEMAGECFGINFDNITEKPPVRYNMKTKYSSVFNSPDGYIYNKQTIINEIKSYRQMEHR
jgi:hypothetical protein